MNQVIPKPISKREEENAIFKAFLQETPGFAGERLEKWEQPNDENEFPDVKCITITGQKIGVELSKWLNEAQIADAKKIERIHGSIRSAVGSQGDNMTKHIYYLLLSPKSNAPVKPNDEGPLRKELFRCIEEVDARWLSEPSWHNPPGYRAASDQLSTFPMLQKYLDSILFVPRKRFIGWPNVKLVEETWPRGQNWILFRNRSGSYSIDDMLQPLIDSIARKKRRYSRMGTGFDSLYLIVYYNNLAAIYNTPIETPDSESLRLYFIEHGPQPFKQIFIFVAPGSVLTLF